jgi:hypothetical protein
MLLAKQSQVFYIASLMFVEDDNTLGRSIFVLVSFYMISTLPAGFLNRKYFVSFFSIDI